MLTHDDLMGAAPRLGLEHARNRKDYTNSIGRSVIRGVYQGTRAVAVSGDTKLMCASLIDLLDLHASGQPASAGASVAPDEVTVIFAADPAHREGTDALRTLASSVVAGPRVNLVEVTPDAAAAAVKAELVDFGAGNDPAKEYRYTRWHDLLMGVASPPALLAQIIDKVGRPELRAYPQLTAKGQWSLRVEGVEAGRYAKGQLTLTVGKDGSTDPVTGTRRMSSPRTKWQQATGLTSPLVINEDDDLTAGVAALAAFAEAWLPPRNTLAAAAKQEEHALESRVLRGLVPLTPRGGGRLQLLDPGEPGGDHRGIVNWGSQFPTRWGHDGGNSARYLDALLRDGDTPWALELKAALPGSGLRAYYRHAVGQAVLYRQFIQTATPLRPWFDRYGLDQAKVRAGVVLPELTAGPADLADRQAALCRMFGLELFWVPDTYAALHAIPDKT